MKRNRAFTLIELLVVIAIIALLMAILMPALRRVQKQAKGVMCQAQLKQWGLIYAMYTDDHDGCFNRGWDIGETTLWMNALRPYYKDNIDLLICPMATKLISIHGFGPYASWERTVATPDGKQLYVLCSYNENSWTNYMTQDRGARKREWFWKNTRDVTNANSIPVFMDGTWNDAWPLETDMPPEFNGARGTGDFGTTNEMQQFCITRHEAFVNGLFMDWSVRKVGLKELWTLKWHRNFNIGGPWTKADGAQPDNWPEWMRKFKDY